jgi:putative spermidine/putrescine transport system substrate-binding protein
MAVGAAIALLLSACGSDDDNSSTSDTGGGGSAGPDLKVPDLPMLDKLGEGEGKLNIIAWAGYAEDGTTDPNIDWVTPFEEKTGCKVTVKIGNTSDEMVSLMQSGGYDGVSASGDASLRMIVAGLVSPVNTSLVPSYSDIFPFLKDRSWNSVNGQMYGIPHGWGANILMYNTDVVKPAPDSWGAVFDPSSPYKGKITAYDSPIYIADAALYLMKTKPELKITNPYALDKDQFAAAVDLLKQQKPLIGEYWADYLKYEEAATAGSLVLGTTWQVIVNTLQAADPKVPVDATLPKEGATGWSDTWMISSKAEHPNCMYMWMDWITSADVNAQVAEYFGEAPASKGACDKTTDPNHCTVYHAADEGYASGIYYWTTPTTTCLDGRGDECIPYSEWVKAWDEIKA